MMEGGFVLGLTRPGAEEDMQGMRLLVPSRRASQTSSKPD